MNVTISTKGQVVIPRDARKLLNLKPGTQMTVDVQGESLVLKRAVSGLKDWRSMQGMIGTGPSLTQALEEEHRAELELEDERLARL